MKSLALVFIALLSSPLPAQAQAPAATSASTKKVHHTYWQPPKIRPNDPMRVDPGANIPEDYDRYEWKIRPGGARVVSFDSLGRGGVIGSVPEGTPVKLTSFRQTNSIIYYALPFSDAKGQSVTGWVNGHAIIPASYTPSRPVKSVDTAVSSDSGRLTP